MARRNIYHLVADAITLAIAEQRLRPGDQLPPERDLTRTYSVGRSSTREALRVLESQGMTESDGRGGFRVADYSNLLRQALGLLVGLERVEIADLFEVRRTLEIESAGLAAARRSAGDLEALSVRIDEMKAALADPVRYGAADIGFHVGLATATGNRLTVRLMEAIRDAMSRTFTVAFNVPGSPQLSLREHQSILAAISQRDAQLARERMRGHLQRVESETSTPRAGAPVAGGPGRAR